MPSHTIQWQPLHPFDIHSLAQGKMRPCAGPSIIHMETLSKSKGLKIKSRSTDEILQGYRAWQL